MNRRSSEVTDAQANTPSLPDPGGVPLMEDERHDDPCPG